MVETRRQGKIRPIQLHLSRTPSRSPLADR